MGGPRPSAPSPGETGGDTGAAGGDETGAAGAAGGGAFGGAGGGPPTQGPAGAGPAAGLLRLPAATALVIGNIVGVGIFLLPAALAGYGTLSLLTFVIVSIGAVA